jgi:hypothetical protein
MVGMIGVGEDYQGRSISGFLRASQQKNQMDLANAQLEAERAANTRNMAVEGGAIGYKGATSGIFAPAATAANGLATGSTGATLAASTLAPAAADASLVGAGTSGLLEAGAASAAVPIAAEGGALAGGEAGMALGPIGAIAGAGLGYLLSKLF